MASKPRLCLWRELHCPFVLVHAIQCRLTQRTLLMTVARALLGMLPAPAPTVRSAGSAGGVRRLTRPEHLTERVAAVLAAVQTSIATRGDIPGLPLHVPAMAASHSGAVRGKAPPDDDDKSAAAAGADVTADSGAAGSPREHGALAGVSSAAELDDFARKVCGAIGEHLSSELLVERGCAVLACAAGFGVGQRGPAMAAVLAPPHPAGEAGDALAGPRDQPAAVVAQQRTEAVCASLRRVGGDKVLVDVLRMYGYGRGRSQPLQSTHTAAAAVGTAAAAAAGGAAANAAEDAGRRLRTGANLACRDACRVLHSIMLTLPNARQRLRYSHMGAVESLITMLDGIDAELARAGGPGDTGGGANDSKRRAGLSALDTTAAPAESSGASDEAEQQQQHDAASTILPSPVASLPVAEQRRAALEDAASATSAAGPALHDPLGSVLQRCESWSAEQLVLLEPEDIVVLPDRDTDRQGGTEAETEGQTEKQRPLRSSCAEFPLSLICAGLRALLLLIRDGSSSSPAASTSGSYATTAASADTESLALCSSAHSAERRPFSCHSFHTVMRERDALVGAGTCREIFLSHPRGVGCLMSLMRFALAIVMSTAEGTPGAPLPLHFSFSKMLRLTCLCSAATLRNSLCEYTQSSGQGAIV